MSEKIDDAALVERFPYAQIDAVGQAGQHRDDGDVAGEINAADPASVRPGQTPFLLERRDQRGEGGESQHAEHLGDAHGEGERGTGHVSTPDRAG